VNNNDVPHQAQRRIHKRAEPADRHYQEARRSTDETDTDKIDTVETNTVETNTDVARRRAEGTDDAGDNTKALADTDEETPNHIILKTNTDGRVWTELWDDRRVGNRPASNDSGHGVQGRIRAGYW
jgi:hypothetical protein